MKKTVFTYFILLLLLLSCTQGGKEIGNVAVHKVAIDTMSLSNPFLLYDKASDIYYMTGDGGAMWRSSDMYLWEGPFEVLQYNEKAWMGTSPLVTSPEIHSYKGRYYYMATFTAPVLCEGGAEETRTSCEMFVSDNIAGPYKHLSQGAPLLGLDLSATNPTFCKDKLKVGYMVYNGSEGVQPGNTTVQIIRLGRNFDVQIGEPYVMFSASQIPWACDCQGVTTSFLVAPDCFETFTGVLGILFTSLDGGEKAIGVAYSETGHLDGPWHVEERPILSGGVSGAAIFTDYDGKSLMVYQKDTIINGTQKSLPRIMRVDTQFDKLKLKGHYKF